MGGWKAHEVGGCVVLGWVVGGSMGWLVGGFMRWVVVGWVFGGSIGWLVGGFMGGWVCGVGVGGWRVNGVGDGVQWVVLGSLMLGWVVVGRVCGGMCPVHLFISIQCTVYFCKYCSVALNLYC